MQKLAQYRLRRNLVAFAFDNQPERAFGKGHFTRQADQIFVADVAAYAFRLKQVFQVMHLDQIE